MMKLEILQGLAKKLFAISSIVALDVTRRTRPRNEAPSLIWPDEICNAGLVHWVLEMEAVASPPGAFSTPKCVRVCIYKSGLGAVQRGGDLVSTRMARRHALSREIVFSLLKVLNQNFPACLIETVMPRWIIFDGLLASLTVFRSRPRRAVKIHTNLDLIGCYEREGVTLPAHLFVCDLLNRLPSVAD